MAGKPEKNAYESDFFVCTQDTARAVAAGRFDEIDRVALADEVESLGKRDRREIVSRLAVIALHLLQTRYQPDKETRSWRNSIARERMKVSLVLADSPSLKVQLPELMPDAYMLARSRAARQTHLEISAFPEVCEWTVAEVLG